MTEKEKMLKQLMYDANYDKELLKERNRAKDLCYEYNQLRPSDEQGQKSVMRKLLGKTKENFAVMQPFWCDYGYNIEIGENFFANHNLVILDPAKVTFGDNVFIAPNCGFYTAGHPIDAERRKQGLEYAYPITVGDNVWIGGGVHVMPGVTIGSNVVIGGGSVVVKDIPDNSVAVGNPCKVIRAITEEDKKRCWDRNPYRFGQATEQDVIQVFALYEERVRWMDEKGLKQWNATDYLEVYPAAYYRKLTENGNLFVLENRTDQRIVEAVVLLSEDERWREKKGEKAYYIHNLVTSVSAAGAGKQLLREVETMAVSEGKEYLRLDCAVDNPVLNEYYESMGYETAGHCQDGPYYGVRREKRLG